MAKRSISMTARSRGARASEPHDARPASLGAQRSSRDFFLALAVCGFLALAVLLVFGQTAHYDFVNLDDNAYIYDNPQVMSGINAQRIVWAFTTTKCSNWHPLTWLSHILDGQLYGRNAGGHHVTSVLLHAAVAILLFLVLWRMTDELWPSALVAAIFAIHPLRAESVAWISERKDVLSGLFFMLTLAAYIRYVRHPFSLLRYLTVVAVFALGLMAKPMLVTLPCILLLLDYWPLGRMKTPTIENLKGRKGRFSVPWQVALEKLPLLVLSVASCVIVPLAHDEAMQSIEAFPFAARVANAVVAYVAYLGQLFFPVGLCAFYPHPINALPVWKIVAALLMLASISIAAVMGRQKYPYLLVGWFWYLGMLVPVIGLVQVGGQSMADRYTYLPQIGLVIALIWGAKDLLHSWPHRVWAWGIGSALVVAILMGCAYGQTSYWRNSETLWTRALECTGRNAMAHNNLGCIRREQGRLDEAREHFENAVAADPRFWLARHNLGAALQNQGRLPEAIMQYQKVLETSARSSETHFNLGNALTASGKLDEAMSHYEAAVAIQADHWDARYCVGRVFYKQGQISQAINQWDALLKLQPDHVPTLWQLAWALAISSDDSLRNGGKAVALADRAARLTGGQNPGVLDTLAAAHAEAGRFTEAVSIAEQAQAVASRQNNVELADAIRTRRTLYQSGSPYRDPQQPSHPSPHP